MQNLGIDRAEAIEVLKSDKAIDRGADPFPLDKEQQKASKQARQVAKAPTVYNLNKRERKPNADKGYLIQLLINTMNADNMENITILNPEREISFIFNGKKYKLTLSAPRK